MCPLWPMRCAPARTWQRAFEGLMAFNDTAELATIAAPTLILWGEHDALFSRHQRNGAVTIEYETELYHGVP